MKPEYILELKISLENEGILLSMERIATMRKELRAIQKNKDAARKRKRPIKTKGSGKENRDGRTSRRIAQK